MDKIEVTQADVAAAEPFLKWLYAPRQAPTGTRTMFEQAFARHRTTRTDATPVAWMYEGPMGEHYLHEHRDCAPKQLASMGWIETPLYPHPPATDVAALVEALRFYAGLLSFPYNAWVQPSVVDYSKGGDGHHPDGPPIPSDTLLIDGGKHARQALAPFTKGQP